jgi:hypothetical protein
MAGASADSHAACDREARSSASERRSSGGCGCLRRGRPAARSPRRSLRILVRRVAGLPQSIPGLARVCLAACVVLQPMGQALHVAFASHRHRHCLEHQQIEDVSEPSLRTLAAAGETRGLVGAPPPDAHVPCRILNAHTVSSPLLGQVSCPGRGVGCVAAAVPLDPPPSRRSTLLLLAPKTSPPTTSSPA